MPQKLYSIPNWGSCGAERGCLNDIQISTHYSLFSYLGRPVHMLPERKMTSWWRLTYDGIPTIDDVTSLLEMNQREGGNDLEMILD